MTTHPTGDGSPSLQLADTFNICNKHGSHARFQIDSTLHSSSTQRLLSVDKYKTIWKDNPKMSIFYLFESQGRHAGRK